MTRPGPGKFEGNESLEVSEYLYDIVGDSMQDDEIGDVETFGWYALITDADENLPLERFPLPGLKPAYIVVEDSNGFFSYTEFDLKTQAWRAWKQITSDYLSLMIPDDEVSVL